MSSQKYFKKRSIRGYEMDETGLLEITITHNLPDAAEVVELFRHRLIALDWNRKGPDPDAYKGAPKRVSSCFRHATEGIAAYKKATANSSERLVGSVEVGAEFVSVIGLLAGRCDVRPALSFKIS